MLCKSPTLVKQPDGKILKVPCKKCTPCKINKTSEWAMRILMEKQTNPVCSFITLTYKNDCLPDYYSLSKEDLSDFFKAYRQRIGDTRIKAFSCGEYGDEPERLTNGELIKRPHYHSIIFNCDNSLSNREALFASWNKCESWKFFGKTWYKTVGNVTLDSASYVAGYCQKKLFGEMADNEYQGKQPPFQSQSRGIGESYFLQHIDEYSKAGCIYFNGVNHAIPETWKRKFNIDTSGSQFDMLQKRLEDFVAYQDSQGIKYSEKELAQMMVFSNKGNITKNELFDITNYEEYSKFVDFKNNLKSRGVL